MSAMDMTLAECLLSRIPLTKYEHRLKNRDEPNAMNIYTPP
jgi:hypothetical protein